MISSSNPKYGTCSWNYDSWVGQVYSKKQRFSADYLPEYAEKFSTVEIDSWFYKIPAREEAKSYINKVPKDFTFTAKIPGIITKPFLWAKSITEPNPNFLSTELFYTFLNAIEPIMPNTSGLIMQFEYLNRQKMKSSEEFIDRISALISSLPAEIPVAIEIRNPNYLNEKYFSALDSLGIIPVLTERMYMPSVDEVYRKFHPMMKKKLIFRLLGDDRKEIEKAAGNKWDKIIFPKENLNKIAATISTAAGSMEVTVNVNNHYEGSGPGSIDRIRRLTVR